MRSSTMAAMSSGFGLVAFTNDGAEATMVTPMATCPRLPSITEYSTFAPFLGFLTPCGNAVWGRKTSLPSSPAMNP